jgi:hypothetical protein
MKNYNQDVDMSKRTRAESLELAVQRRSGMLRGLVFVVLLGGFFLFKLLTFVLSIYGRQLKQQHIFFGRWRMFRSVKSV